MARKPVIAYLTPKPLDRYAGRVESDPNGLQRQHQSLKSIDAVDVLRTSHTDAADMIRAAPVPSLELLRPTDAYLVPPP